MRIFFPLPFRQVLSLLFDNTLGDVRWLLYSHMLDVIWLEMLNIFSYSYQLCAHLLLRNYSSVCPLLIRLVVFIELLGFVQILEIRHLSDIKSSNIFFQVEGCFFILPFAGSKHLFFDVISLVCICLFFCGLGNHIQKNTVKRNFISFPWNFLLIASLDNFINRIEKLNPPSNEKL